MTSAAFSFFVVPSDLHPTSDTAVPGTARASNGHIRRDGEGWGGVHHKAMARFVTRDMQTRL